MRRKRDPERKEVAGTHVATAGASGAKVAPAEKPRTEAEEIENQRALDEAAGVAEVRRSSLAPPPFTRPANAQPLIKTNTREKLLYKIACTGTPLGDEFFDKFPDRQEILELSLDLSARLLIVAILNSEMPVTQRIASMRVVAALAGKVLAPEESETTKPSAPPLTMPTGATDDVEASLKKFREMSEIPKAS